MNASPSFLQEPGSPALQQLRELLLSCGYATSGIAPTVTASTPPLPEDVAPVTPRNTLLRLFAAGDPVPTSEVAQALRSISGDALSLDALLRLGFVVADEDGVRGGVVVQPYDDLLFAFGRPAPESSAEQRLMFISPSSVHLANLMIRHPARRALDLGTGCGYLAAIQARHAEHVYAVDVNPSAVHYAEFNCRWNGLSNVTCIEGNMFQPVRDLRFDRIVCNPPFLISPVPAASGHLRFRDSGAEGDAFCIQLAREAAKFLVENGCFHMMYQWIEPQSGDWAERLSRAFAGVGCDAWGLRVFSQPASEYIREWAQELEDSIELDAESLLEAAEESFRRQKVGSIGSGLLTLRRCSGRPGYLWFDEAPEDVSEPYGDAVAAILETRGALEETNDTQLLDEVLLPSPHITMVQESRLSSGFWEPIEAELSSSSGLRYTCSEVSPLLVRCIELLDGKCTLLAIFDRIADESGNSTAQLKETLLTQIRDLLRFGLLRLARLESRSASASL